MGKAVTIGQSHHKSKIIRAVPFDPAKFIDKVREANADLLLLSALTTSTKPALLDYTTRTLRLPGVPATPAPGLGRTRLPRPTPPAHAADAGVGHMRIS